MSYPHIFWEGATTNSTQIVNSEQGGWPPCLAMKRYNSFHINSEHQKLNKTDLVSVTI